MFPLPFTLGPYSLDRKVGQGALSVVYHATATTDVEGAGGASIAKGASVAVKVLRPERAGEQLNVDRFRREATRLGELAHANVIRLLDVVEEPGALAIVQPFLAGGSLADTIARWKALAKPVVASPDDETLTAEALGKSSAGALELGGPGVDWVADRMTEAARGLAYLHGERVLHRDLKPANLFLAEGDVCMLADFGLSRAATDPHITLTEELLGTPAFMAPEIVMRGPATQRSDVWSFGASFYELLSSRVPTSAAEGRSVLDAVPGPPPKPLRELVPCCPTWLASVIDRCLEPDPELRFADGAAVLAAILSWRRTGNGPAGPALAARARVLLRRNRGRVVGVGAAALVATILWTTTRGANPVPTSGTGTGLALRLDSEHPMSKAELDVFLTSSGSGPWRPVERALVLWRSGRVGEAASELESGPRDAASVRVLRQCIERKRIVPSESISDTDAILTAWILLCAGRPAAALTVLGASPPTGSDPAAWLRTHAFVLRENLRWEAAQGEASRYLTLFGERADPAIHCLLVDLAIDLGREADVDAELIKLRDLLGADDPRHHLRLLRRLARFRHDLAWKTRVAAALAVQVAVPATAETVPPAVAMARLELASLATGDRVKIRDLARAAAQLGRRTEDVFVRVASARLQLRASRVADCREMLQRLRPGATTPRADLAVARAEAALAWDRFAGAPTSEHLNLVVSACNRSLDLRRDDPASALMKARARFVHAGERFDDVDPLADPSVHLEEVQAIVQRDPSYAPALRFEARLLTRSPDVRNVRRGHEVLKRLALRGQAVAMDYLYASLANLRMDEPVAAFDDARLGRDRLVDEIWHSDLARRRLSARLATQMATVALRRGGFKEAIGCARRAVQDDADFPDGWAVLYESVDRRLGTRETGTNAPQLRAERRRSAQALARISRMGPRGKIRERAHALVDRLAKCCRTKPQRYIGK